MYTIVLDFFSYKIVTIFQLRHVHVRIFLKKKKPIAGLYTESFNHLFVRAFSSVHLKEALRLIRLTHLLKFALTFARYTQYGGPSHGFADSCTSGFVQNDLLFRQLIYAFRRIQLLLLVDIYRISVRVIL